MKFGSLLVFILSFTCVAQAQNKVSVLVSLTPAGSFTAKSDKLAGDLVKTGNEFSASRLVVSIQSFKTGISLRDEHFRKHFDPSKNPNAILTDLKGKDGKATANLEVNGVKKPVSMTYQEKGSEVVANLNLKASDFKLPPAKYLGVGVRDEVKAEITMAFKTAVAGKK
jgi:polyisoprenoid-binding protein YceI